MKKIGFVCILLFLFSNRIFSNTIEVNSINDSGSGTLRDAISNASDGDTITFNQITDNNSIILSGSEVLLNKDLTIIGNGASKTIIDGNANSRIFNITSGKQLLLMDLKIQNGFVDNRFGSAIYNEGSIIVNRCSFENNNNGLGAIGSLSAVSVKIYNSWFKGNKATSLGGAVFINGNSSPFVISNTIFSGNRANVAGAIYIHTTNGTITNSTFTGNQGNTNGGACWVFNSTVNFTNNIISGNTASAGPDVFDQNFSTLIDNGYNLIGTTAGSGITWNGTGSLIGVDPMFKENVPSAPSVGGDLALQPLSPAIDAGTPDTTGLNIGFKDVFGNPRISGGRIDIGAAEAIKSKTLHFDGIDDYGKVSLGYFQPTVYTIEAWVKFDGDPANQNIFMMSDLNGPDDFYTHQIRVNKDGFFEHSTFIGDFSKTLVHTAKPEANTWYHLAIRARPSFGNNITMWVNGVEASKTALNVIGVSSDLAGGNFFYIGKAACGLNAFKGEISEIRVWDQALSNPSGSSPNTNDPNLKYYYTFEDGAPKGNNANPVIDSVINNIDGTDLPSIKLFNFELDGETSNFLDCNQLDTAGNALINPQNQEVEHGQAVSFTVQFDVNANSNIQWYKDNELLVGATNNTLDIQSVDFIHEGSYYAIARPLDDCPIKSESAELVVNGNGETLNFDGVNDHVLAATNDFGTTDGWVTECWFKFEGNPNGRAIFTGTNE
ncbi:MAG: LamG-like jellyroll fold domain-containing protein, partial [Bacteroidota bacterium]